jgi:hypothetical protein
VAQVLSRAAGHIVLGTVLAGVLVRGTENLRMLMVPRND